MKIVCVTNNPRVERACEAEFVDGAPYGVFVRARDMIHCGWALLMNPLYGNFGPKRQPYRTLVLREGVPGGGVDAESLRLIESAFEAWRGDTAAGHEPGEKNLGDYAMVDYMLASETLREYKLVFKSRGGVA